MAGVAVSVVISTLERTASLRRTLLALRYQSYGEFEVIVVDGPARDTTTAQAISELDLGVRYVRCPEENISRSRNVGIDAAAGEIVAFIDDDAIPEPGWLEQLVSAYDADTITGAGGIVYDPTGVRLQYRYSLSDRVGTTRFDCDHPPAGALAPGADPFLYLQGTNMSFRRSALVEIGGFDEEIEYNFDEAEVCLCLIDRGHQLRPLAAAAVHHKTLPSRVRGAQRILTDPYSAIKNRAYFALRYGTRSRPVQTVLETLRGYGEELRQSARAAHESGRLDAAERERFTSRVDAGLERGIEVGLAGERRSAALAAPDPSEHRPFSRLEPPEGRRRRAGFVTERARVQALQTATEGHDTHLLVPVTSDEPRRLDFEAGVWVHRFPVHDRHVAELDARAAGAELYALAATWIELAGLDAAGPVDCVWGPSGRTSLEQMRADLIEAVDSDSQLAERLLDRSTYPLDRLAEVRSAWRAPPDQFVRAVYRAALERTPADSEVALWTPGAGSPGWRLELVRAIALSGEARSQGTPLQWLDRLKRHSMSPMQIVEDRGWQMSSGERAAIEGALSQLRPNLAIEIGSARGGSLRRIAAHAGEVHSFDLEPPSPPVPDNVVLHTGDSHELLPGFLAQLAERSLNVDFVVVDGDHTPEGVRRDLEALLDSRAVANTVILIHDTANERVRAGVDAVRFAAWPKVFHVELDWIPGQLFAEPALRNELWYGLGLVLVDSSRPAYLNGSVYEQRYHPAGPLLHQVAAQVRAREQVPPGVQPPEAQAGALRVRTARLETELTGQRARADALAEQLVTLEQRWAGAERALEDIKGSISWRITDPVRAAKRLARGRKR